MSDDNGAAVFNAAQTDISDDWRSFLQTAKVDPGVNTSSKSPVLTLTHNGFGGVKFDTKTTESRYQKTDYNAGDSVLLAMSADMTSVPTATLGNVISTLNISDAIRKGDNVANDIIAALGTALTLAIDQTDRRNAMWLTAGHTLRLDTALSFTPTLPPNGVLDAIENKIKSRYGISLSDKIPLPTIIIQQTCQGIKYQTQNGDTRWHLTSTFRLVFKITTSGFVFWIGLDPRGINFSMTQDPSESDSLSSESFWGKMTSLGGDGLSKSSAKPVFDQIFSDVRLLRVAVGKDDPQSKPWWQVDIGLLLVRSDGTPGGKAPVEIHLSWDSKSRTFRGGLILAGFYASDADKLLPTYVAGQQVDEPKNQNYPEFWDLRQISTELDSVPPSLPTAIALAAVSYRTSPAQLWFYGKLVSTPQTSDPGHSVPFPFTWDELDLSFSKEKDKISCSLSAYFTIMPPENTTYEPADFGLTISYNQPNWLLSAYVDNLSCGLLWSFFDPDCRDGMVKVLSKLSIDSLAMMYTYDSKGGASSFLFTGTITLGTLELRLFYQYASSSAGDNTTIKNRLPPDGPKLVTATGVDANGVPKTAWSFECDLGASNGDATIMSIASSICDDASFLPSFIGDIKVPEATGRGFISLKIAKTDTGKVLFALKVTISPVTLTFLQVTSNDKNYPTKRLIRFAVDKIPMIENIPLLSRLPQPFDQLEYVWVNDAGGWLRSEVDAMNDPATEILSGEDMLLYKLASKADGSKDQPVSPTGVIAPSTPDPVVIVPGHHFMVIQDGALAIDHVFFTTPATDKTNSVQDKRVSLAGNQKVAVLGGPAPPDAPSSPPSKGALSFTFGPLSVSAVTLQFKTKGDEQTLCVTMDATFAMGPISFSLLGFGMSVPLKGVTLDNLVSIVENISVVLQGLDVSFNKPPMTLAGGFEHSVTGTGKDKVEVYLGGIALTFPPYTFVGVGEYAILNGYKSVFVYARLDGPLVTLEFASISGVRLGFGFNSVVRDPDVNELTQFPFINDKSASGAGNDPMKILKAMTSPDPDSGKPAWVTPRPDSYWLAAGMSVAAFDILTITVVTMFAFRDAGLIISIYADAIAQMPPMAPLEACIVYVESAMVAEMNFVDGYLRIEDSLAPTSFLLVPSCHLYGGFAFVYWFNPNEHAGDWVFSIGGYHRSYTPSPWYPVPKRLGIAFQIGRLHVVGESYFAVTPKAVMGGAMIQASLSVGPVDAWLDAVFDALVNFHPLHYTVDFNVSVGVEFSIDIGLIHIHISAHVNAMLHIEGPEFGGEAYVDFYLFGFDIYFGAESSSPPPLNLHEFWDLVHKPGPQPSANGSSANDSTANASTANTSTTNQHDSPVRSLLVYTVLVPPSNAPTSPGNASTTPANAPTTPGSPSTTPAKVPVVTPINEPGAALKFVLENGSFPMPKTPDPPPSATAAPTSPTSTGAGAAWYVKGGSFQFRIASDFAMSKALITLSPESVAANQAVANASADDEAIHFRVIQSQAQAILSRPMQLKDGSPISSVLKVTVTNKVTGEIIDNWRDVSFALPNVPTAIWSAYSEALDPQHTKDPPELLNGNNPTMPQSMALMLTAPPPELAEGLIPVFKATAAARFGILDFRTDTVNGTNWILKAPEPTQTQYLPQPLTTAEIAKPNVDKWQGLRDDWSALASKNTLVNDKDNGCLAMCAQLFGWSQNRAQTDVQKTVPSTTATTKVEPPPSGSGTTPAASGAATGGSTTSVSPPAAQPATGTTTTTTPAPAPAPAPASVRQPWQLLGSIPSKLIASLEISYLDLPRIAVI